MGDSNRKQALLPQRSHGHPPLGHGPGLLCWSTRATLVVALPGVPWELKEMWESTVEPRLRRPGRLGRPGHAVRRIRTFGIGESMAAERLADLPWRGSDVEIGTRASLEELTIILRGPATPEGARGWTSWRPRSASALGDRVFGVDGAGPARDRRRLLLERGLTVAVAESCTGGLVGKRFTDIPGSSDYFLGGVTAYHNDVKMNVLGVPAGHARPVRGGQHRGGRRPWPKACRDLLHADCALSTTGVAGPGGGTDEKPVGLVFIGSVVDGVTEVERLTVLGPPRPDQGARRAGRRGPAAAPPAARGRRLTQPAGAVRPAPAGCGRLLGDLVVEDVHQLAHLQFVHDLVLDPDGRADAAVAGRVGGHARIAVDGVPAA